MEEETASDQEAGGEAEAAKRPGVVLIIFTVIFFILDGLLSFYNGWVDTRGDLDATAGYITGNLVGVPGLVMLFFIPFKDWRNARTLMKVYFWVLFILFFTQFATFSKLTTAEMNRQNTTMER